MHTLDDLWNEYCRRRVLGKASERALINQYERYIKPTLGHMDITKIKFVDVEALHLSLKHIPFSANRSLVMLRAMYKIADALEWLHMPLYNPARWVKAYPERKRRRHMTPQEAPVLAKAMADWEGKHPHAMLYLWLLIFTGARSGEIANAKWKDLKDNVLTLQKHKTQVSSGKDRIIVLPQAALDKIEELAVPLAKRRLNDFIILSRSYRTTWYRMIATTNLKDLRIHDLRHTFGTYALSKGYSLDQIGEALNHTNPNTTKIYAELTNKSRQVMATDVSIALFRDMKVISLQELEEDPLR